MDEQRSGRSVDDVVAAARAELNDAAWRAPSSETLVRRGQGGRVLTALLVVVVALAAWTVGSLGPEVGDSADQPPAEQPDLANEGLLPPGEVRPMAASPLLGRSSTAVVWTGSEMIVWGGEGDAGPLGDGAAYDPVADSWRSISPAPLTPRGSAAAVWTGSEMIVWGGHAPGLDAVDGAAYDPSTDTWREIADAPIVSAGSPPAVWTGSEMIVMAGFNSGAAAAYDPSSNAWRTITPPPGRPTAPDPQMVWMGSALMTKLDYPMSSAGASGFYTYDPAQDEWSQLPDADFGPGWASLLVASDTEVIAIAQSPGAVTQAFDPAAGSWRAVAEAPPDAGGYSSAVWTGEAVLLFDGGPGAVLLDPVTGTWTPTPGGAAGFRTGAASVWADGVLLVWGGFRSIDGGFVLAPVEPQTGDNAPSATSHSTTTLEPDLKTVVDANGVPRGVIDLNGPPAEWDGELLPVLPVLDDGQLVGYFGCRFLERDEVETESFDPSTNCQTATTATNPAEGVDPP